MENIEQDNGPLDHSSLKYGSYALDGFKNGVMNFTRSLPDNWLGRRLGFTLRKLVHGGRSIPVDTEVFGQKLRLYPFDNKCEKRVICLPQFFDPSERQALADFAKEKDTFNFIDLGSNVGLYSLFIDSLDKKGQIIAIEADPYIYSRLRYNIDNNQTKITAHNIAVSDNNGTITLHINTKNRGENSIVHNQNSGEAVTIACKRLLTIMDEAGMKRADAVKLDLEGAEEIVLTSFFKEAPKERYPELVLIENAPDRWTIDIYNLLEQQGYILDKATRTNRIYRLKNI